LLEQLDRSHSAADRLIAIEVLGTPTLHSEQIGRLSDRVSGDPLIAPASILAMAQRSQINPDTARLLLSYVESSARSGWSISQEQLTWLGSIVPVEQKGRADKLKLDLKEKNKDQLEQLNRAEKLLSGGTRERGKELFFGVVGCSACHRIGTEGGLTGPDLTKIGAIRSGRDLAESVLFPSATFAQGYEPYRVALKSGDDLIGIRVRQSDGAFVLRDASGTEYRLDQKQIEQVEQLKGSLMPEGLLGSLPEQSIRDLFAFLQSLK